MSKLPDEFWIMVGAGIFVFLLLSGAALLEWATCS